METCWRATWGRRKGGESGISGKTSGFLSRIDGGEQMYSSKLSA